MILVIAALKGELLPLIEYFKMDQKEPFGGGTLYPSEKIHLLRTGTGMKKAHQTLSAYLEIYHPEKIINMGTAGSLNPEFTIGLMTEPETICNIQNNVLYPIPLFQDQYLLKKSKLITVNDPVISKEEKEKLLVEFNADIVDMEAFAIGSTAMQKNIEFHNVKIISDYANEQTTDDFKNNYKIIIEKLSGYLIKYLDSCL